MTDEEFTPITCPFCKEEDFDEWGLKYHLAHYCEKYNEVKEWT